MYHPCALLASLIVASCRMMKHSDTREIVAGCPNPPAAAVAGYGGIRWWSYCRYEKPSIWASAERLL